MNEEIAERLVTALERLSLLAAMDFAVRLGEDADLGRKAERLQRCGFSNAEIANILDTTPNSIGVALHRNRALGRRKRHKR